MGAVAGVVGAVGGLLGEGISGYEQSRDQNAAAQAAAQANILKNRFSQLQAHYNQTQQLMQVRAMQAKKVNQAAAVGGMNSSGFLGMQSSFQTQMASNLGFNRQLDLINQKALDYENQAISYGNQANDWGQAGGFFGKISGAASSFMGL